MIHGGGDTFSKCSDAPAPAAPACEAPKSPKKTARNLWGLMERATKKKSSKGQSAVSNSKIQSAYSLSNRI